MGRTLRNDYYRTIRYDQIRRTYLITFGRSARIVVESDEGLFDFFAVSDGQGEVSMGTPTAEMHRALARAMTPYTWEIKSMSGVKHERRQSRQSANEVSKTLELEWIWRVAATDPVVALGQI